MTEFSFLVQSRPIGAGGGARDGTRSFRFLEQAA
jgi:hypothetical protein